MRKSKILAWKSLFLRRKSKIRARQSSGSLRSEASQGSSTASRRATRVLDKLPRGFVFNYGELALPGFEVQSVLPLFRPRAFLRGRERKASWRNWLQQTTPRRFSTGTTIVSLRSSITYDAAKSSRQQEQIERETTEAYCPCDASAEQASQPGLAVEHTIIPTFDVQKEKAAQFMRAIGDLEAELKKFFPYHLSLAVDMAALQKGQKWTEIRDALRTWLRDNVQNISSGQRRVGIPNVAFDLMLERDDNLPPSFIISRVLDPALA